jgi:peptidoglycan-associated lipoprotein
MKHCATILCFTLFTACHTIRHPLPSGVRTADPTHGVTTVEPPLPIVDPAPAPPPEPTPLREPIGLKPPSPRDPTTVIIDTNGQLRDAFFDYDRSAVRPDAVAALEYDARLLAPLLVEFPQMTVTIEGHCDERGSAEYNLGLGDHRARRAAEVLSQFGIAAARIQVLSYGKEAPECTESNEACWQRNRRAHVVVRAGATTE